MRTRLQVSREELMPFVEEYIQERIRIRRAGLRETIIHCHHQEGTPVPEGEEMETHIDVLEGLMAAGLDDADNIVQFFVEIGLTQDGELSVEQQILRGLENRKVKASQPVIDETTLQQYQFTVTGKIMIRCRKCRRGSNRTEQEFTHDRFLQRMLIGQQATCPYCHTGQLKVYGVTAVLRDSASRKENAQWILLPQMLSVSQQSKMSSKNF